MRPEQETTCHETRSRLYEQLKQGHRKPLQILRALTILRQMALHPSLVLGDCSGGSGKMDVLLPVRATLVQQNIPTVHPSLKDRW